MTRGVAAAGPASGSPAAGIGDEGSTERKSAASSTTSPPIRSTNPDTSTRVSGASGVISTILAGMLPVSSVTVSHPVRTPGDRALHAHAMLQAAVPAPVTAAIDWMGMAKGSAKPGSSIVISAALGTRSCSRSGWRRRPNVVSATPRNRTFASTNASPLPGPVLFTRA